METFIIGTAEDAEAEYGVSILNEGDTYIIICLYNDEIQYWNSFRSMEDAKADIAEVDRKQVSYL